MINILFSLAQFLFFCLFCAFIIKKYIPVIKSQQDEEQIHQRHLEERRHELNESLLNAQSLHQEHIDGCDALLNKVIIWKQRFEQQKKDEEEKYSIFLHQAQTRHQKQIQLREIQLLQQILFPRVADEVGKKTHHIFLNHQRAFLYNEERIKRLQSQKGS